MLRFALPSTLLCVVSVFSLALFAPKVHAQSNFDVFAQGTVSARDGEQQLNQEWLLDEPNQLQTGDSASLQVAGANARGGSSAAIGQLKAYGFTNAQFGQVPPSFSQTAIGSVIAVSQWYDHLTVVSDSLPINTPVSLMFTYTLEGNIYVMNPSDSQLGRVIAHVDVSDQSNAQNITFNYSDGGIGRQMQTITFDTFIGDRLQVRGDLEVDATANSSSEANPLNESDVDFGHTAYLSLSSATAGASYLADSGHIYTADVPADVPEPKSAAFLMSLVVFGGVVVSSRRSLRPHGKRSLNL